MFFAILRSIHNGYRLWRSMLLWISVYKSITLFSFSCWVPCIPKIIIFFYIRFWMLRTSMFLLNLPNVIFLHRPNFLHSFPNCSAFFISLSDYCIFKFIATFIFFSGALKNYPVCSPEKAARLVGSFGYKNMHTLYNWISYKLYLNNVYEWRQVMAQCVHPWEFTEVSVAISLKLKLCADWK